MTEDELDAADTVISRPYRSQIEALTVRIQSLESKLTAEQTYTRYLLLAVGLFREAEEVAWSLYRELADDDENYDHNTERRTELCNEIRKLLEPLGPPIA